MNPLGPIIARAGLDFVGQGINSYNQRRVAQQNQGAYDAAAPSFANARNTINQIPRYNPTVNWANQRDFSAPRPAQPFGSNTRAVQPLNQGNFFRDLTPYDPRQEFARTGPPPDTTRMWNVQPYDPTAAIRAIGPPPSLQEMLARGTINESAFERIKMDPRLRGLQMKALAKLEEIANNDGMTLQDRVRLRESMDTIARQQRMQRYAILQDYEARGLSGSGIEIATALAAHQAEVEGLSIAGAEAAARGEERALQATMSAGQLAGEIASQDYEREARLAAARDAIATFNASQTLEAIQADFRNRMTLGQAYAEAGQTYFNNWMSVVQARENAAFRTFDARFRMAEAFADAGNNWFNNTMNVARLNYMANQDAYENYFNRARALDDYAVSEADYYFRSARAEYDSYMDRLQLLERQGEFRYSSDVELARLRAQAEQDYGTYLANRPGVPPKSPGERALNWVGDNLSLNSGNTALDIISAPVVAPIKGIKRILGL